MGYEEPEYTVDARFDAFEVRRYAPYVVAAFEAGDDFDRAGYEAFRPLADFIGGENEDAREMAMTAPVEQRPGRRLERTAPVLQDRSADLYVVRFILPGDVSFNEAPQPRDERIRIEQIPERTMAVRRYRGGWSQERFREERDRLLDAVDQAGYATLDSPIFARYNSPFMIWFLRRNEVMVEVETAR